MNFIETVSQELEALIDRERGAVRRRGRRAYVRDYPISPDVAEIAVTRPIPRPRRPAAGSASGSGSETRR
jgi:hypothetical protein